MTAAIARIWRGVVRTEDRDVYAAYVAGAGVKECLETPGNRDGPEPWAQIVTLVPAPDSRARR